MLQSFRVYGILLVESYFFLWIKIINWYDLKLWPSLSILRIKLILACLNISLFEIIIRLQFYSIILVLCLGRQNCWLPWFFIVFVSKIWLSDYQIHSALIINSPMILTHHFTQFLSVLYDFVDLCFKILQLSSLHKPFLVYFVSCFNLAHQ